MTDDGRLDLRYLDAGEDPERTDALMRSILAEIELRPREADIRELRRYRTALLAAAAMFIAIALGATRAPRGVQSPAAELTAEWARDGHVPTNGELLAAYQGYRP